jgi:hypothetical protein
MELFGILSTVYLRAIEMSEHDLQHGLLYLACTEIS